MKVLLAFIFACFVFLSVVLVFSTGYIHHKGAKSDHFDGKRFFNQEKTPSKSFWTVIYWRLFGDRILWPREIIPSSNHELPQPTEKEAVVTFINHASSLIQTGSINILTDPQYNDMASPVTWAGPYRVHEPGIPYEKLPQIDLVIISHDHYDHMDEKTLKMLQRDHDPIFLVGLGNDVHLNNFGISKKVKTLDWYQPYELNGTKITFVPAQHFSGRGLFDRNATLWGGYVVEIDEAKLFFAGDTGYGPHFKEIFEKFGPMDLSMLPIGSYLPRWFMKAMHVNPEEAVLAHIDLKSKKSYGIHFQTFQMSDEPYDQPAIDLELAKIKYKLEKEEFVAPDFGESFIIQKHSSKQ